MTMDLFLAMISLVSAGMDSIGGEVKLHCTVVDEMVMPRTGEIRRSDPDVTP
jgi:hypothetical protein